jgi:hypothetical protein
MFTFLIHLSTGRVYRLILHVPQNNQRSCLLRCRTSRSVKKGRDARQRRRQGTREREREREQGEGGHLQLKLEMHPRHRHLRWGAMADRAGEPAV